ncbi:DUF935 family protein [uncultured Rikenella sp.]|uniref:phage portal protein family protein n=1 Tax=uncultured Rikenella sp. TaxID=368003 RepID=UPI0025DC7280|nr:DUF935 family protein [uncultured Rikenella sp.]
MENKQEQELVINQITIKAPNRTNLDIDNVQRALRSADRGKRQQLYNLYAELMRDNVLRDAVRKRVSAITNAELVFTRDNKPEETIDRMMDSSGFESVLTEIMQARFLGITVTEMEFVEDRIIPHPIPSKHIRPQFGEIALEENDERGIPYREDDFFLEVGEADDLGLLLNVAPFVLYKRNNFGDWAQYAEIFGMPMRTAYYETFDDSARLELQKALEAAGGALVNILPKGSDFKVEPGAASGDGGVYDMLRKACNEEILIGILGQTLTTIQGDKGARSLGEVHMQVQEDLHNADRRFVQRVLNTQLLPLLEKRGFPVSGGCFAFVEQGENLGAADRLSLVERAAKLSVPVPTSHVYKITGIPQPEADEEVVEPNGTGFVEPPDTDDPTGTNGARNFLERVFGFFAEAPVTGATTGERNDLGEMAGDGFDRRLAKRVARGEARYFDRELFDHTADRLLHAFHTGWRKGGIGLRNSIEYGTADDVVLTAMETNLYHFSAAKTLTEIQQLNQAYRASRSFEDYMERAAKITDTFNRRWAQTEYDTADQVAESTSTYYRLLSQNMLFPYWEYRTVGDDKVRPEHAALNGLVLPTNDPRWGKIYPPNGWNCRCYVLPRMRHETEGINLPDMQRRADAYFETGEFKTAAAQGFGVNRAELREVFTTNQQYIRKFPNRAAKYLNRLGAVDYGLPTMAKRQTTATSDMPRFTGTAEEWFAARQRDGVVMLTDRSGRKVFLSEKSFRTHTTGSHAARVEYLQALPETLNDPDEVWINAERGKSVYDNYTLIRYYRDEVIVVCCKIAGGRINEVRTWFPLAGKKSVQQHHRRGLLVYNKKASE